MRSSMPSILGNLSLRQRLCNDILAGATAHAYILCGPHGSGKHTIAMAYAAAIACENKHAPNMPLPCGTCPTCRKILEKKSPDIIVIGKDGLSVKIHQIRALLADVRTVPNDLEDKFYIVEDADTMTEEAQNAFLLTLEEPPSFVHFFLLCQSAEPLLETVRSRAPVLRTEPLARDLLRKHITSPDRPGAALAANDPDALEEALTIANGSLGRLEELLDQREREPLVLQRRTADELLMLSLSRSQMPLIELVNSLPQKQDELLPILNLVMTALRDLIVLKQAEDAPLCFYTDREATLEKAYSFGLSAMLRLYDILGEARDSLLGNANLKVTLTAMLEKL